MPDDADVYARLESPLHGGLVQVLCTLACAIGADAAAARVFDADPAAVGICVLPARLKLDAAQAKAVNAWPRRRDSIFEALRRIRPRPGVSRARDHFDERAFHTRGLFRPIEAAQRVTDCLCDVADLGGGAWAVLLYIRCAPSRPFEDEHLAQLRRFHVVAQRNLHAALRREIKPVAPHALVGEPAPLSRLLARLSRTECRILGYLRTPLTERQIAGELERSHHTVHVHVKNIYRKFGVSSRKQLVELFQDGGA